MPPRHISAPSEALACALFSPSSPSSHHTQRMAPSAERESIEKKLEECAIAREKEIKEAEDPDAEFGGTERRKKIERKLLLKIDLRMSIFIVIYILNYVRHYVSSFRARVTEYPCRLTATTRGTSVSAHA